MAGGKGTRFKAVTTTLPKLLIPLNNRPLIDYIIEHVKNNDCDNIIICAGYLGDKIQEYIDRNDFGISIKLSRENKPLGTAGALRLIEDELEDEFFILYGDIYTTINLQKMLKFHKQRKSDATLALHTSDHPQDSTVVKIDKNSKLLKFIEKPGDNWRKYGNLTTTPLYILKKEVIDFIEPDAEVDFAKDIFPKMLKKGKRLFGYVTYEYAKDMGIPERYQKVQEYVTKLK